MGFNPLTLALAKQYTDKVFGNGGTSGGTTEPVTLNGEVIYPITTLPFEEQEGAATAIVVLDKPLSLVGGENLTIVFDGKKYETNSRAYYDNSVQVGFGNLGFAGMGADTGEPFLGVYVDDPNTGTAMMIMTITSGASHTFGIAKKILSPVVDMSAFLGDFIEGGINTKVIELSEAQLAAFMEGVCKKDMLIAYKMLTSNNAIEATINQYAKPWSYSYGLFPVGALNGTEWAESATVTFIAGENCDQIITITALISGLDATTTVGLNRSFMTQTSIKPA